MLTQLILETCLGGEKIQRLSSPDEVIEAIQSAQEAALVTNGLYNNSLVGLDEVFLDLFKPGDSNPRYTVHILDQNDPRANGKFAAFIVPQGRETDWIFSTPQGRKQLLKSAGFNRLAVVSMHRGHDYVNLDAVKEELSESVKSLAPKGLTGHIPYLSLGSDVGKRNIIYKGFSDISGEFVVEDVGSDVTNTLRRLIFLKNQFLIQSEARMKPIARSKHGKMKMIVDPGYLACSHHIYMTVGVQLALQNLAEDKSKTNVALIGLGGGGLCTFLRKCFDKLQIMAVDIDPAMLTVAQQYFGLVCDERIDVQLEDGIKFLKDSAEKGDNYEAILFDIDSKDTSLGISCPPKQFLEMKTLKHVKTCLGERGFFILNLVCRDEDLRTKMLEDVSKCFSHIASYKIEQEVNEIFFCTNMKVDDWKDQLNTASNIVNTRATESRLQKEDLVDLRSLLDSLKIDL